jgi:hypothetical protein
MKKNFIYLLFLTFSIMTMPYCAWADDDEYVDGDVLKLNENQREYYLNSFNNTMDNTADDKSNHWQMGNASGNIRVSKKYISKSKSLCRNYSENMQIGDQITQDSGSACKRKGKKGWCKLKADDAHTCAFEGPDGFLEEITDSTEKMSEQTGNMMRGAKNWRHNR